MLTFYQKTVKDQDLRSSDTFKVGSWVHAENPTEKEIQRLVSELNLDPGHLKDALDPFEVPHLEIEQTTIYIFSRIPYMENTEEVITTPLLIAVGSDFVATISRKPLPFLHTFGRDNKEFFTTQKIKMLLLFLSEINTSYTTFLTNISRQVRSIRVHLEEIRNADIVKFVAYESTLNDFLSALVPANTILQKILSGKHVPLHENDTDLMEDLSLGAMQLIETSRSTMRTIVNIREAYSTIMTNNLNRVIKILTSLTIVLMVPTIIASLYGMNVPLPYANSPIAFPFILGLSFFVSLVILGIFIRKRWL